jgi:hypothetical protein
MRRRLFGEIQGSSVEFMSDSDGQYRKLSHWTFSMLKPRGLYIYASCTNERCGRIYTAAANDLIAQFGPDATLSQVAGRLCEACNAPLSSRLAAYPPDDEASLNTGEPDPDTDAGCEHDGARDDRHWD